MAAPPMLDIKNLGKRFPARAGRSRRRGSSRDMSFSVGAGELLTIVGPSGAGKSTLLNIIAQIDTASAGEIVFDGDASPALSEGAASGPQPPHRLRHPGRQPAAMAHHHRQRAVSLEVQGTLDDAARAPRAGADRRRRTHRFRALLSARTIRRYAQARGAHPYAGVRPADDPDGRAVRGSRCADPYAVAAGPAAALEPQAEDHPFRYPRYHRGDRARRPVAGADATAGAHRGRAPNSDPPAAQRQGIFAMPNFAAIYERIRADVQ